MAWRTRMATLARSFRGVRELASTGCAAVPCGLSGVGHSCCGGERCQPDHPNAVVCRRHQVAGEFGPLQTAVPRASEPAHHLHPPEDLLHALADTFADGVADVARGALVDRTPPATGVLRHVR